MRIGQRSRGIAGARDGVQRLRLPAAGGGLGRQCDHYRFHEYAHNQSVEPECSDQLQSFSIGQNEGVQFVQPTATRSPSTAFLGPDPSSIFGGLSANGKVFLVNPNGVSVWRRGASERRGLVASTLNLTERIHEGNYKSQVAAAARLSIKLN